MSLPLLTYRDFAAAVAIVLLAFALRVIVVFDRAQYDPVFDPLPEGTDQLTYVQSAAAYAEGTWPAGPFEYQPGVIYYFVAIRALVGPSLGMMRLVTSLTGALSCGLLIGAGWLLTGRRWGGWLSGLLMALYPVAIFWSTALLIPVLATFYVSLFVFLALWQRQKRAFWRTVALGVTVGLLTITRFNLALVVLAWPVYLVLSAGWRATVIHTAVLGLAAAVTIAPVTLWNIQQGSPTLVSSAGMNEVYRANNRDADGLRSGSPAMDIVPGSYEDALFSDIRRDPLHFIELQGRKMGIYWSDAEPGNNLDYFSSGEMASPLLRLLPLDFRLLSLAGLLGLGLLLRDNRHAGVFLALVNLLIFAGVMALWIEGRLRQPAVVPLVLTGAYLLTGLPEMARARRWRALVVPGVLTAVLLGFSAWAIGHLPGKHPVSGLPADVRPAEIVFDGKLRFVGWRTLPEWSAPALGWGVFTVPYAVELFWEVLEPVERDYSFYLAYVADGARYAGRDRLVGGISFPDTPTSTWQPGAVYSEIAGFRLLPGIPTWRSGAIQLGVYVADARTGAIANMPVTAPSGHADYVTLQPFALIDLGQADPPPDNMTASGLVFGQEGGDQIALEGYALPAAGGPGEVVTLSFYWQALDDIRADYNLFVHVMDADNNPAAQHDGPPREGALPTSTWPHIVPVRDDVRLALPEAPGTYSVYIGLYHAQTHDRLLVDAPDSRPLIGEIVVREGVPIEP